MLFQTVSPQSFIPGNAGLLLSFQQVTALPSGETVMSGMSQVLLPAGSTYIGTADMPPTDYDHLFDRKFIAQSNQVLIKDLEADSGLVLVPVSYSRGNGYDVHKYTGVEMYQRRTPEDSHTPIRAGRKLVEEDTIPDFVPGRSGGDLFMAYGPAIGDYDSSKAIVVGVTILIGNDVVDLIQDMSKTPGVSANKTKARKMGHLWLV